MAALIDRSISSCHSQSQVRRSSRSGECLHPETRLRCRPPQVGVAKGTCAHTLNTIRTAPFYQIIGKFFEGESERRDRAKDVAISASPSLNARPQESAARAA